MTNDDLYAIVEATVAYENLSKHVLMNHRKNLTKSQMDILIGLHFIGRMNMTQVSRHLAASKEQASRATAPLVDMGYVVRSGAADNHRTVEVSLTRSGKEYLEHDLEVVLADMQDELSCMPPEDLARLIEASKTVAEILGKNPRG